MLIIFILILALVFCTFAGVKITTNVQNKQMEKLNSKELFSYIVYDNQDEKNIKTLVTINSENGIEYIECPDGRNQLKYEKQDKKGQNKQIGSLILFQCLKHALPPPSITPGGLL